MTRLEISGSCEIDFTLRFKPLSPLPGGGYSNQGTTSGTGELSGSLVTDLSHNGLDPDPDNNNDPTDNNDPTPVSTTHTPGIGIAKSLYSGLTVNTNGSYSGTFRVVVENLGNEALESVGITDAMNTAPANLGTYVAGGAGAVLSAGEYTIQSAPAFSGTCSSGAANAGFNGSSTPEVAAISLLDTGTSCTIDYGFRFFPQPGITYLNQAGVEGTGTFSTGDVDDLFDDGTDPDPDGDQDANEAGENDPTLVPIPRIGIAKSVGTVVNKGDGTYSAPFTLTIENSGETSLSSVQISDDLSEFGTYTTDAIPTAARYTLSADPIQEDALNGAFLTPVASGLFTGEGTDNNLLVASSSTLPNYGSGTRSSAKILFTIRFFPVTPGPFNNTAVATGSSPSGGDVTDDSVSGDTPDADSNGDPGNDTSPTVVNLTAMFIGAAKSVSGIIQTGIKSYDIPFSIIIVNPSSTITSTYVQLTDDLNLTFPTAETITIRSGPAISACTGTVLNPASPSYDGITQTRLLSGSQNLQPNESCTVSFTAAVSFGSNPLPDTIQYNQATATAAETPGGALIVTDQSDDGTTADSDGNGNAGDTGENDPTPINFTSSALSSVTGKIWLDSNHDRIENDGIAALLPTSLKY